MAKTAHLYLLGTGGVGRSLIEILRNQANTLRQQSHITLSLAGLANSQQSITARSDIPWHLALEHLSKSTTPTDLGDIAHTLSRYPQPILVDMTASETVARSYPTFLRKGIAVVTPNKRANTLDQAFYDTLQALRQDTPYAYETTVGAALPVISTLQDLVQTGDQILHIDGILSGTLAFVCNQLSEGISFSEAVLQARAQGFTEPDPRDDLMGEDVARKLLILAREAGLRLERADITVESLVPDALTTGTPSAFLNQLPTLDASWHTRVREAQKEQRRLQYVGHISKKQCHVGIQAVSATSPFAHLRGTDNMVIFTTARYQPTPLVIQGAGAGPILTAAGVLADILKVIQTT